MLTGLSWSAKPATAAVVRDPVSDTASHSRMPRAAMALGCNRMTPRRESTAAVFSRAVSVSWGAGGEPLFRFVVPRLRMRGQPALAADRERDVAQVRDDDHPDQDVRGQHRRA